MKKEKNAVQAAPKTKLASTQSAPENFARESLRLKDKPIPPGSLSRRGAREASAASSSFAIAIMAAGKGTRLKSKRPKVLHQIGGKTLLEHVIAAAAAVLPPSQIYAIVGHESERVREAVSHTGVGFILQSKQRGTGHAVMCTRKALAKYDNVLVLSGDVPLIKPETIRALRDFHLRHRAAMTLVAAEIPDPSGYGRVTRKAPLSEEVVAVVEQKALTAAQTELREINAGIYAFAAKPLFAHIDSLTTDNAHKEFYLTDMAGLLARAGERVVAFRAGGEEVLGANTLAELADLDAAMRSAKASELMSGGVTIFNAASCVIDQAVRVGADTVIEPFVQILGRSSIGSDCHIRSFSVISDSEIGDGVMIRLGCIIDQSRVDARANLGPYCHLRPGSEIGEGAHVGNFVETKKTKLGKGSKANHLSYLGDSQIGEKVNIGAGTITCNYDGVHKHATIIEDGAFVGSDSILVAPVKIGRGAYVGAASCITDDVPGGSLALGRARQVVIADWATKRREAQKKS